MHKFNMMVNVKPGSLNCERFTQVNIGNLNYLKIQMIFAKLLIKLRKFRGVPADL